MPGLLLLFAHPDDESFFAAGTIAKNTSAGIRAGLVCATRGERGATGDLCSIDELPAVREAELRAASEILGISELEFLPYQDQQLDSASLDEIRRSLVAAIRRQRPDVVLTFDPHGANQHRDHIAIGRFAMDAIAAAADERWCPDTGAAHAVPRVLWTAPVMPFRLGETADLVHQPGIDFLIDIAAFRSIKDAALRAHRTQFPGLSRIFQSESSLSLEAFRIGGGPRPRTIPSDDLFAY